MIAATLFSGIGAPETAMPEWPRYKALGNSMAVPVVRWILERVDFLERQ